MSYFSILQNVRGKVNTFIDSLSKKIDVDDDKKKEGGELVGVYIQQLFEDAEQYRKDAFAETQQMRMGYSDPMEWGKMLQRLESGCHWSTEGGPFASRRSNNAGDDNNPNWMAEVVDDEVQDQVRTRNAHLTGSWHEIQVMPNINNLSEILDQERKKTNWGKMIRVASKMFQIYGDGWIESFLDKSEYPEGVANERVRPYLGILLSPYATGKKKSEGCRYVIIPDMVTGQQVLDDYPDFDLDENSSPVSGEMARSITIRTTTVDTKEYKHTKLYARLRCYMDDAELMPADFDPEECNAKLSVLLQHAQERFDVLVAQVEQTGDLSLFQNDDALNQLFLSGVDDLVPIEESENHEEYVKMYTAYAEQKAADLEGLVAGQAATDVDTNLTDAILRIVAHQVGRHIEIAGKLEERGIPSGKKAKYPHGRLVVTIDGRVAEDVPNPYLFEWRNLIHRIPNEEVIGRIDGRGDVEILFNSTKMADEQLSRHQDEITLSFPKKVRHQADKGIVDKDGETNNPLVTDWYASVNPPIYQSRPVTGHAIEMFRLIDEKRKQRLGITNVTRGESPTTNASGDLAEILVQQNTILISGEANENLNDGIESIIETKLMIMRTFYTEPRPYMINGVQTFLTLSKVLATAIVEENGQQVEKQIDKLEVSVRPDSNSPLKWERDLSFVAKLASDPNLAYPDGTRVVPMEAVQDLLAERFPQFGRNGKYAQVSKATAIGMQVLQQQQAQAQAQQEQVQQQQSDLEGVKRSFQRKQMSQQLEQIYPQTGTQ